MNERVVGYRHRGRRLYIRLMVLLSLLVLAIVACGGSDQDAELVDPAQGENPELAVPGTVTLVCDVDCAERGQCGQTADRTSVVLLNLEGPAVAPGEHDLTVPANTPVTVMGEQTRDVAEISTGVQFPIPFYRVFVAQQNLEGWVAGWCLDGIGP